MRNLSCVLFVDFVDFVDFVLKDKAALLHAAGRPYSPWVTAHTTVSIFPPTPNSWETAAA
jgi:hypothetical protein